MVLLGLRVHRAHRHHGHHPRPHLLPVLQEPDQGEADDKGDQDRGQLPPAGGPHHGGHHRGLPGLLVALRGHLHAGGQSAQDRHNKYFLL